MHHYRAYGLRIHSDIAFPFDPLPDSASAPDLVVRIGAVPASLPDGLGNLVRTPFWQARPGVCLIHVEGVVRCLVSGGRHMLVEPLGGDDPAIADIASGAPFTALLQQRGMAALHTAAVATEAGAVLLCGPSGTGKSSLAAVLVERGYPLLSDNLAGVTARLTMFPAFGRQRLSADVVDRMRWRHRVQREVRTELPVKMAKYWVPAQPAGGAPLPVRAAFVLGADDRPDIRAEPVPPCRAFWLLCHNTERKRMMIALGQRRTHFRVLSGMARHVPVALLRRPFLRPRTRSVPLRHLLDALADRVDALLREAGSAAGSRHPAPRLRTPRR